MLGTKQPIPLYDKNSREEEAELSLKHTQLTPGVAWMLVLAFLCTIVSEAVFQQTTEMRQNLAVRQTEITESGHATHPVLPDAYRVVDLLPSLKRADQRGYAQAGFWRYWHSLATVADIQAYENDLEETSQIGQWLLPRTQFVLTGHLGAGNEQAYIGRDGWLFYRPEVDYVANRGFLDPLSLRQRARSGDASTTPVQPDPVKAIVQFKQQLAKQGIELIVMPAPVKPVIEPEMLSARYAGYNRPVQNPSYALFVATLQKNGVHVVDVSQQLLARKQRTGMHQYLATDTHWNPEGMDLAASILAQDIRATGNLPAVSPTGYTRDPRTVSNLGDIADMLKLPSTQRFFKRQQVTIQQVHQPDGQLWRPDRDADVLLLGDSFCNIYSLGGMRWGEGAGFVEQLSYYLQRPLDKIVINAGGSFASRQELVNKLRDFAQGKRRSHNPLAHKRIVIYEFAMRDLLVGDWKLLDLPDTTHAKSSAPVRAVPQAQQLSFTVTQVTPTAIDPTKQERVTISFTVPTTTTYRVVVRDSAQTVIATLQDAMTKSAGSYTVTWDGKNRQQAMAPAGTYTVAIEGTDGKILPGQGTVTVATGAQTPVAPPANGKNVPAQTPAPPANPQETGTTVQGNIAAISMPPKPGSVAYKDCVIAIHLTEVKAVHGAMEAKELLIFTWGMRDNKWTRAAELKPGQTMTCKLTPWDEVEDQYGGYNRMELDGDDLDALDLYWGDIK